jgi:hypothetical protein
VAPPADDAPEPAPTQGEAAYALAAPLSDDATRRAPTPEEAEALARVAALAIREQSDAGPSRAVVGAAVGLGVLVVALLLLVLIVSVGADSSATP